MNEYTENPNSKLPGIREYYAVYFKDGEPYRYIDDKPIRSDIDTEEQLPAPEPEPFRAIVDTRAAEVVLDVIITVLVGAAVFCVLCAILLMLRG